jgi:hypothetical protein
VSNPGIAQSLTALSITAPAGFQLANNNCGSTLAPGGSCATGVVFSPAGAGAQSGNLTVTSAGTSVASAALQGIGFDFTVAVSASSSLTVSSGQSANYTVILTPMNGSQGTFSFTCGSLPQDASCIFNPANPVSVSGNADNIAVEITTSQATARMRGEGPGAVIPILCGLLILPFSWRKRRKTVALVGFLAVLLASITSCTASGVGAGGGGLGTGGSTPPGTYSIPVTATANCVQHTVTLTLTVD